MSHLDRRRECSQQVHPTRGAVVFTLEAARSRMAASCGVYASSCQVRGCVLPTTCGTELLYESVVALGTDAGGYFLLATVM
jgi:hypothetical protein